MNPHEEPWRVRCRAGDEDAFVDELMLWLDRVTDIMDDQEVRSLLMIQQQKSPFRTDAGECIIRNPGRSWLHHLVHDVCLDDKRRRAGVGGDYHVRGRKKGAMRRLVLRRRPRVPAICDGEV